MNETTPTVADSDETTNTDDAVPTEALSDPESLREREDVPFVEETNVHDDEDHCSVGIDGRAVVGVTNDDGEVLLLVNEAIPVALLPNESVEPGDDWAAAARRAVEEVTDLTVELDGIELVRDFDHFVKGEAQRASDNRAAKPRDDERHATSYNVVFRASPVETGAEDFEFPDECDWSAGWFDEFPANRTDEVGGPVEADIRLFVD